MHMHKYTQIHFMRTKRKKVYPLGTHNYFSEVTGSSAPSHVTAFHPLETQLSVQRPQLKPLTEEENTLFLEPVLADP